MSSQTLKMTEERNFRSSYYERVGCRGVEEKKSLEILLKDKPWDKNKLKQFCLRFTVPAAYRNLIWKVLLGILPVYSDSHEFVMEQRVAQYEDLLYAQNILKLVDETATQPEIMLAMWQLETGQITAMNFPHSNYPSPTTFKSIASSLLELGIEDVDIYWCSKALTEVVKGFQSELPKMKDVFLTMLDKEDHELYSHILEMKAFDALPLTDWLNCAFAGVLDETSLAKIWDKLVAGAPKILSYVGVMLLITMRRCILRSQHCDELLQCLSQIPEKCEEVVANKAIELWQYYGANPQNEQIKNK